MQKFDYKEFQDLTLPTESEIMMSWQGELSQPVVSLVCITYNQEKYIRDTIKGFLIQKTIYPFEIVIHDDASTDKTAEIIKEYCEKYPAIIRPIFQKENQYSKGKKITPIAVEYAVGEYIALCEGDDFWIDKNKLQKQIDIFLSDSNVSLVHSNCFDLISMDGSVFKSSVPNGINTFETLINDNRIRTLTAMFPVRLYRQYLNDHCIELDKWSLGDWPLWLYLSLNGTVEFLTEHTSVYRIFEESASHSKDVEKCKMFIYSTLIMRNYFVNKYGTKLLSKHIGNKYVKFFLMLGIPLDHEFIKLASINYKILFFINRYIPLKGGIIRINRVINIIFRVFLLYKILWVRAKA